MFLSKSAKYNRLTDLELIEHYRNKANKDCLGILFDRYTHLIFGVCMKYLKDEQKAQDAVMNIFEQLMTDLLKHEIDYFKGWLHTVVRNYCLMQLRKEKSERNRHQQYEKDSNVFMQKEDWLHLFDTEDSENLIESLNGCMEKLKPEQKRCIELFYLQERCYKSIASETEFDIKKVKSYIQNGKRNLKICLESTDEQKR